MKPIEENGTPFLKQVSKLFEDLAAGQRGKPPISPRITCTRLRRLREIRCELVETSDPNLSIVSQGDLEVTVAQLNSARTKNESFASWVLRNKQAHRQFSAQSDLRGQGGQVSNLKEDKAASDSSNAFANFSVVALQKVAKNPNTPPITLKWLAAHYRADVRQAVAENPNIGKEIMTILAGDIEECVRIIVTENTALSRDLLLILCDDSSPLVSEKAKNVLYMQTKSAIMNQSLKSAENPIVGPNPTQETNKIIAKRNDFPQISSENAICKSPLSLKSGDKSKTEPEFITNEFLQVIAERSTTPPRRLAELAMHPDKLIRCMVAANPNATPEILWHLAKDDSIDVRRKLLSNYNCPEEVINYLMRK